jgi:hypothetical protein
MFLNLGHQLLGTPGGVLGYACEVFFGLLVGKNMRLSNLNSAQAEVFVTAKKPTELRDLQTAAHQ